MQTDQLVITEQEFDALDEGAKRAFKRSGNSLSHYFRCTTGPKAGKLASDPSKCGQRPDPKKVRHGRKVAKLKGSIRVRKTQMKKRTELSKRISNMNRQLQGHNSAKRESFLSYHQLTRLIESVLETIDCAYDDHSLYSEVSTLLLDGKYDYLVTEQFRKHQDNIFEASDTISELIVESLTAE